MPGWLTDTNREKLRVFDQLDSETKATTRYRVRNRLKHTLDDLAFAQYYVEEDMTFDVFDPEGPEILSDTDRIFESQTLTDGLAFLLKHILIHHNSRKLETLIEAALKKAHEDSTPLNECSVNISIERSDKEKLLTNSWDKAKDGKLFQMSPGELRAYLDSIDDDVNPSYDSYTEVRESVEFDVASVGDYITNHPDDLLEGLAIMTSHDKKDEYDLLGLVKSLPGHEPRPDKDYSVNVKIDNNPTNTKTIQPLLEVIRSSDDDKIGIIVGPDDRRIYNRLLAQYLERIVYFVVVETGDGYTFEPAAERWGVNSTLPFDPEQND